MATSKPPPVTSQSITVMLLGKTGNGKSSLGNLILSDNKFRVGEDVNSCTAACFKDSCVYGETEVVVIDTVGFCDTNPNPNPRDDQVEEEKLISHLGLAMAECVHGLDCFILVLNYADRRMTSQTKQIISTLKTFFSDKNFVKHLVVVFTHKDVFDTQQAEKPISERISFEKWCSNQVEKNDDFKHLLEECGKRCFIIQNLFPYNDSSGKEIERKFILDKIQEFVDKNGRVKYTNQLFLQAASIRDALVADLRYMSLQPKILSELGSLREMLKEAAKCESTKEKIIKAMKVKTDAKKLLETLNNEKYQSQGFLQLREMVETVAHAAEDEANVEKILQKCMTVFKTWDTVLDVINPLAQTGGTILAGVDEVIVIGAQAAAACTVVGVAAIAVIAIGNWIYKGIKHMHHKKKKEEIEKDIEEYMFEMEESSKGMFLISCDVFHFCKIDDL